MKMSNLDDQKDELAALESIYANSDATSKCVMNIIDDTHLQFKFGEEGGVYIVYLDYFCLLLRCPTFICATNTLAD
jgi:hypothetical protein